MISTKIVADSKNRQGDRLTTMLITFPRIILAELNTHRMLSKNSASSRAIPFEKMVNAVRSIGFTPIAWQKDHKGMQGTEYFTDPEMLATLDIDWNMAKIDAIERATLLHNSGVTKQYCNRMLEAYMMHTVLISGTEWENFFSLRCPQYQYQSSGPLYRSWNDLVNSIFKSGANRDVIDALENMSLIDRLKNNTGQAEIHMMALAESMWDAYNASNPKELNSGEWHIPFEDQIADDIPIKDRIKLATAMAARTSYTIIGDEKIISNEKLINIHDKMAKQDPFHASPFEHCAKVMADEEYHNFVKGYWHMNGTVSIFDTETTGWCRNFKGFIQYRYLLESDNHFNAF